MGRWAKNIYIYVCVCVCKGVGEEGACEHVQLMSQGYPAGGWPQDLKSGHRAGITLPSPSPSSADAFTSHNFKLSLIMSVCYT